MKDFRIGYVTTGHSDYDDEVWELLSWKIYPQRCFTKFEHLDLADCFILAGADIKSRIERDEVYVESFIDPEGKSDFMARFDRLIEEKYACLGDDRRD